MESNTRNIAIRTSRFARKFSTWKPPSFAEGAYPQNCMVEQPRNQVSEMQFDTFPNLRHFSVGKRGSRPRCVPVQTFPQKLCCGSKKWRWSTPWTILRRSQSIRGYRFPNFEVLDAKIASALKKIITNPTSKRKSVWRSKRPKWKTDFSVGRQIVYMIYEYFLGNGALEAVLDFSDLFSITLHGDN